MVHVIHARTHLLDDIKVLSLLPLRAHHIAVLELLLRERVRQRHDLHLRERLEDGHLGQKPLVRLTPNHGGCHHDDPERVAVQRPQLRLRLRTARGRARRVVHDGKLTESIARLVRVDLDFVPAAPPDIHVHVAVFQQIKHVADVALHQLVACVTLQAGQGFGIARVGELIEVHDRLIAGSEPVQHKVGANKTCAAGYKNHLDATVITFLMTSHALAISASDNVGCTKNITLVSPNALATGKRTSGRQPVPSKALSRYTSLQLP